MTVLDDVRARQRSVQLQIQQLLAKVQAEGRDKLHASEDRQFAKLRLEAAELESRIGDLDETQSRRDADAAAALRSRNFGGFGRGDDNVYARGNGQSYFLDLAASAYPGSGRAEEARQRLTSHAQVIDRAAHELPYEFRVNPNRTDGQGGYFVPPLWLVDEYIAFLRAGRATADRMHKMVLPGGTDVINLPKITTGSKTGYQADGGVPTSQDMQDNFVSANVRTIAGSEDVALQLLDQSPISFDEVIFQDLTADYNQQLDVGAISGTGTGTQIKGLTQISGGNAVTFTSGSPTVPLLWTPLAQALSLVSQARFLAADTFVMHPRRWYWIVSALDSQNRPLATPDGSNGMNIVAVTDPTAAEGIAGSIMGIPVVIDANMTATYGAGSNQDRIFAGRFADFYLWEGELRTRALTEVLSGTLQIRCQLYNYVASMPDRYPGALTVIDGTGLTAPSGF